MTWSFPQFNFTGFNESLTALGYVTSESCGKVTVAPMEKKWNNSQAIYSI
jgi:hypothetical protein